MTENRAKACVHLHNAERILRKISDPLSNTFLYVAAVLLTAMMLLVAAAVIMRYFFNSPILGDMEVISIMLVGMVSFSMAYCARTQGHVRVMVAIARLPARIQAVISVLVNLFSLGFLLMVVWYSAAQGMVLWKRGFATIIFKIPLFPFAFILSFGFAVFALVIIVELLDSLAKVVEP